MKAIYIRLWRYLLLFNLLLLNACISRSVNYLQTTSPSNFASPSANAMGPCLPPIAKLAYPVGIPKRLNEEPIEIRPQGDWQFEATLPETLNGIIPQIATRMNEVWVSSLGVEKVFQYQTETHQWKSYTSIGGTSAIPRDLFVSRDGTLWGIGVVSLGDDWSTNLPMLSYYNDVTDQFEPVQDIDGLLVSSWVVSGIPPVSEDQEGLLWFFASKMGPEGAGDEAVSLYSFDPVDRKAEKRISMMNGFHYTTPVVAPDGSIWFYHAQEGYLYRYSPDTGEARPYYGIPSFERIGSPINLFFDRDGRLWVDNKGWLDFSDPDNPTWYEMIPSTAFLTDQGAFKTDDVEGPLSGYGFAPPIYISQSSNGWMWFTTLHGTIRLDLEKEEWCLFTNGGSPVLEDDQGYVWITVFDGLYKLRLVP